MYLVKRLIMGQFDVKVKWGKEKYEVTANTEEAPEMFKAQLFALTNVPLGKSRLKSGLKCF